MRSGRTSLGILAGCGVSALILVLGIVALYTTTLGARRSSAQSNQPTAVGVQVSEAVEATGLLAAAQPSLTPAQATPPVDATAAAQNPSGLPAGQSELLVALYDTLSPGVVNIQVFVNRNGQAGVGAGSGFVLDAAGNIVTNNHVVAGAEVVTVIFADGTEARADVVGVDPDSDLAVLNVSQMPAGVRPLPLGDSDKVKVGEWVIAIGNPFGLGTSMSVGIVSAIGRVIASGATPFNIPQAVQTDAAINPGNSGGPLLNLNGEVVGVNAQIVTGGARASSGVGFAIPANIVRRVAPALISTGKYEWPWLGVEGRDVNLLLQQANNLPTQDGAYIHAVVDGGPAAQAGLRGTTGVTTVDGIEVPVGGDVVIEANGQPIKDFSSLLVAIDSQAPGDQMALTILREGQSMQVNVTLAPRPATPDTFSPTPLP